MKRALFCLLLLGTTLIAGKDAGKDQSLPLDPSYIIKTLPNGLTYYIRTNAKPENRAELRLVVNTGSITEDDDQQGLAHFIEHMAFNGSTHFSKNELVDYLQSIGMRFGAHLNAYTSFDETVYQLKVPVDEEGALDKAFLILEDWAHGVAFDGEEIDKERGVVVEEWRSGRGASARIFDKQSEVLFHDSRYAERLPIGKPEILKNAPHDALKRYYRDWYRPGLMAVVAIGDFDPAVIEKKIVDHFSKIEKHPDPRPRKSYRVPGHEETLYAIETDPELTASRIQVLYKHEPVVTETMADYRRVVIEGLNQSLFNQRLGELGREADPPFVSAFAGMFSYVRGGRNYGLTVNVKDDQFEKGMLALLREVRRVERFGFTQSELDRVRTDLLRNLEVAYNERDKQQSRIYTYGAIRHFLEDDPLMSIEQRLALYREILPKIGLDELNRASSGWMTEENRVVLISAPEKDGLTVPTRADVAAWFDKADKLEIEPYRDDVGEGPLVPHPPEPGKVVATETLDELGVTRWTLANGIRVVLKPTDFKNDQILFTASSPGGSSLVENEDYPSATLATMLINASGVGSFEADQLRKKLAGKAFSVRPSLGTFTEGLSGSGSPEDLETGLQLTYLYATSPRLDEDIFTSTIGRFRSMVQNREKNPNTIYSDTINEKLYKNHPRVRPFDVAMLEEVDREKALAIYRDRFADFSDFTFVFVGNFEPEKIRPQIEKWIGGLPTTDREETWRDTGVERLAGKHEITVEKGLEPRSSVSIRFHGDHPHSRMDAYALSSLIEALKIRYTEVLREDMGGVYGTQVGGSLSRRAKERFMCTVSFTCDPERVDDLLGAVYTELETRKKEGFDSALINKVKEAQMRSYEEGLEQNNYWLRSLATSYEYGEDPHRILEFEKRFVDKLDEEMLLGALNSFFLDANRFQAVLMPEKQAE